MAVFDKPCLVDVDTQADFVLPTGALYVPGAEELIPIWKQLTEFGQTNHLWMLASMDRHRPDDPEFGQFLPHCIEGTSGQAKIPETLAARYQVIPYDKRDSTIDFQAQVIMEKQALDVFTNAQAEEIFAAIPCTTFAVYGLVTECCVRLAVLGLLQRGYRVHILADAIRAFDSAVGERALAEMANAGAGFIQSATFLEKVRQHLVSRAL